MKLHANARTCPNSRRLLVDRVEREGWEVRSAAGAAGISERTAYRWLARWRAQGAAGLMDRSSAPRRVPHATPPERVRKIEQARRLGMTGAEIAEVLGMALSTVSAILKRIGLGKRSRLEPPEPPNRYERRRPGELLHVDIKQLGRIRRAGHRALGRGPGRHSNKGHVGWEYVHVCVDDHSRLAYAEVLADQRASSAVAFLRRAVAFYARHGITVERVMTDNGPAYLAHAHRKACHELAIKHLTTRPYRPRTNGKAERFIQTLIDRWAYARIYRDSTERTAALPAWLNHYNYTRPHGSLSRKPPSSRLTNLTGNYT